MSVNIGLSLASHGRTNSRYGAVIDCRETCLLYRHTDRPHDCNIGHWMIKINIWLYTIVFRILGYQYNNCKGYIRYFAYWCLLKWFYVGNMEHSVFSNVIKYVLPIHPLTPWPALVILFIRFLRCSRNYSEANFAWKLPSCNNAIFKYQSN